MFKTKIYIGLAVIVFLGVLAMAYIYRSLGDVAGYLATLNRVSVPFSVAALEMEKNTGEYANGVLRYLGDPDPALRDEAAHDVEDFTRRHAIYMRLSTDERERSLGRDVGREHQRLAKAGNALMNQRDQLDKVSDETTGMLEQIDRVGDDQMVPAAPKAGTERSTTLAAIANIEAETAEIGFWLTLFRGRPAAQTRESLLAKVREQQSALSQYRKLPLAPIEQKLIAEVDALHLRIANNVNQLIIGETDVSQRAQSFDQLATHIDDIFDNQIQMMLMEGLSEPQENSNAAINKVQRTLLYIIPAYFLAALVVGVLFILAIVRPLQRLAEGTAAIGAGDLDHHIDVHGNDEFGKLATQFNQMTARLKDTTVSRNLLEISEKQLQQTVAKLRDEIAERHQAEREREGLQVKLRRSETLAAMGQLVAGVAHEVRNPLFGISSTLDAMEANTGAGPANPRYRDVLRREANRLNKLMAALLEYGRSSPAGHAVEPLGKTIADAVEICRPAAESAGVSVDGRLTSGAPVAMNYDRLLQVFVNLIENAIQHAPQGSEVVVATRATADVANERWVECTVADSGPGFAPEDLPHVFDPFFTRRRKGTGLGLAIVRRIVDEHHGTVEPSNRPEGGAVMTVRLPVAEMEP